MCCEGSRHRRAPMRSRRCSGSGGRGARPRRPAKESTCKAPLAHLEGGSGRSEASPTAILQDTHSLVGKFSEVASALLTLHTGHVDQLEAGPQRVPPSLKEVEESYVRCSAALRGRDRL